MFAILPSNILNKKYFTESCSSSFIAFPEDIFYSTCLLRGNHYPEINMVPCLPCFYAFITQSQSCIHKYNSIVLQPNLNICKYTNTFNWHINLGCAYIYGIYTVYIYYSIYSVYMLYIVFIQHVYIQHSVYMLYIVLMQHVYVYVVCIYIHYTQCVQVYVHVDFKLVLFPFL